MMGWPRGGYDGQPAELQRSIEINGHGVLVVEERGSSFEIEVSASRSFVRVGCTKLTREAWEEIQRRVARELRRYE